MKDPAIDAQAQKEAKERLSKLIIEGTKKKKKEKAEEEILRKLHQNAKNHLWAIETQKLVTKLAITELLDRLQTTESSIDKRHPKCSACGILFGGYHIAFPANIAGIGQVCQWCFGDYKKYGRAQFLKRIKQSPVE